MDIILKILLQLGANSTAFIQFGIFIFVISFLTVVVYGPYFKARDERLKLTKGADQVATETQDEAKKLELIYQARAREINEKVKNVFDDSKSKAQNAANNILNQSKTSVATMTEKAKSEIGEQKQKASQQIESISQEIAREISKKLTGAV